LELSEGVVTGWRRLHNEKFHDLNKRLTKYCYGDQITTQKN